MKHLLVIMLGLWLGITSMCSATWNISSSSGCSGSRAAASCSAALRAISSQWTITFRVRRNDSYPAGTDAVIVAGKAIGTGVGFHVAIGNVPYGTEYTGLQVRGYHTGGVQAVHMVPSQGTLFPISTWTPVAVTCNWGVYNIYVNGTLYTGLKLTSTDQPGLALAAHSAQDLRVAYRIVTGGTNLDVELAEIAIFDEVLTPQAIKLLASQPLSALCPYRLGLSGGPVAFYRCDSYTNGTDAGRDGTNTLTLANIIQGTHPTAIWCLGGNSYVVPLSATPTHTGWVQTLTSADQSGGVMLHHLSGYPISLAYVMRIDPESTFWYSGTPLASPWPYRQAARGVAPGTEGNVSGLCTTSYNTHQPCLRFLYRPDLGSPSKPVLQAYVIWGHAGGLSPEEIAFFNAQYGPTGWWHAEVAQEAHIFTPYYIEAGATYFIAHNYYAVSDKHHATIWIDGIRIFDGSFPNAVPFTLPYGGFVVGAPIVQYIPTDVTITTYGVISHLWATPFYTGYPTGMAPSNLLTRKRDSLLRWGNDAGSLYMTSPGGGG